MAQTREGAIKIFCNRQGITVDEYDRLRNSGLKWCTGCKRWVSVENFNKDTHRYDGLCSKCTECTRVKIRKTRKGMPSPLKGRHLPDEVRLEMSKMRKGRPQPWHSRPRTDEERKKISEAVRKVAKRGAESPNWKGGKTRENELARQTFAYSEWRTAVFRRDGYVCQECGYDKGGILQAHHILGFTENEQSRLDVDNGVTLCKFCHQLRHTKDPGKRAEILKKRDALNGKNED